MSKSFFVFLFVFTLSFLSALPPTTGNIRAEVDGRIHTYGNRYIIKETGSSGQWFVLLENQILEKLIKQADSIYVYSVKGQIYTYNTNHYLLPISFKKIPRKTGTIRLTDSGLPIEKIKQYASDGEAKEKKKDKRKYKKKKKAKKAKRKYKKKNKRKKSKSKRKYKKKKKAKKAKRKYKKKNKRKKSKSKRKYKRKKSRRRKSRRRKKRKSYRD